MTYALLTCSEYFTDFALNELCRQHPDLTLVESVSPQHLLVKVSASFSQLTRPWRDQVPIYVHHLFPVHRTLSLTGNSSDFACLRQEAEGLCHDDYVVQARILGAYPYSSRSVEHAIRPSHISRAAGRVLSTLIVDNRCYMGISWGTQNISPYACGSPYFDEPVPNRAGLKLLEALLLFKIHLRHNDHALDLGAAPGAWTEILRRRGMQVTAVAPNLMYDWLETDPNVHPVHTTAEAYLPQCKTSFDLIVNDMKLDAQDSARLMVQYAPHLRLEGIAIMTLKLHLQNRHRVIDHALRLLRKQYKIIRMRQLVSNRKEVTLFLRRKE